jgi:hypothetical protein
MPNYKFKAHDSSGSERAAAAVLADDDEAVALARRVIAELMKQDAELYTTWTMDVVAGKRSVSSIPFEPTS